MANFPESDPTNDGFDEIVEGLIMSMQGGPLPDDLREQHDKLESINNTPGQVSSERNIPKILSFADVRR